MKFIIVIIIMYNTDYVQLKKEEEKLEKEREEEKFKINIEDYID